jgi:hypothetical protein
MRIRGLVVLTLGVVLAGGAVMVARTLIDPAAQPVGEAEAREIGTVVVANADIPFGAHISYEVVRLQDWPLEALPPEAFLTLDELLGSDAQEPRRARRSLVKGEPLVRGKVSDFGERVTIADAIDPEKRVMTIRVDDVSGVGGFVTPGDRVDVVMIRQTTTTTTWWRRPSCRTSRCGHRPDLRRGPRQAQRGALGHRRGLARGHPAPGPGPAGRPALAVPAQWRQPRRHPAAHGRCQPTGDPPGSGPSPAPIRRQPTVTVNRGGTRTSVAVGGS